VEKCSSFSGQNPRNQILPISSLKDDRQHLETVCELSLFLALEGASGHFATCSG